MSGPLWDSENNNMHPTCKTNASGLLNGEDVAFISQIRNNEVLTVEESNELYRLWHKVLDEDIT